MKTSAAREYDYKVRDASGRMSRGRLRALSKRDAAKRLSESGFFVLRLRPASSPWLSLPRTERRFPVVLCRRLALMLSAGMTIGEALRVLAEQRAEDAGGRILTDLYRAVADGEGLSEAMARQPHIFTPKIVALVDAGERSGSLDVLLGELADSLEADYSAREKLLTLMLYPCVLAVAVAVAVGFLMTFVFPVFVSMFQSLSIELPFPTRLLLGAYDFLADYGLYVLVLLLLLMVCGISLYRKETFRVHMDGLLLRIPVFGRLVLSSEQMRLAGTLSVLLSSGLVIDRALAILESVASNAHLRQGLRRAHSEVQKGYPLSEALRGSRIFSPMLLELLAAGEAVGEMETMLAKIASYCRLDMETYAERVRVLLPPLSLLFIGGIVGFIIFSTVLPLLDSMTAFM